MRTPEAAPVIGNSFCHEHLEPGLLPPEAQVMTERVRDGSWELFEQIGVCWKNVFRRKRDVDDPSQRCVDDSQDRYVYDSSNLRSSWQEFVEAKTTSEPNYVAEYVNAVGVIEELIDMYGREDAYQRLFFASGVPDEPPSTRIAHAKQYVVDEFIRVQITAGGHKGFGGENYHGYIGGSRYRRRPAVRAYESEEEA